VSAPELVPASDRSLLVRFADEPTLDAHRRVVALLAALEAAAPHGLVNLHPGYASLLVVFDPRATNHEALLRELDARLLRDDVSPPRPRTVEVPVVYGGEAGPDLADVAAHAGLSPAEVVARHAGAVYSVRFLGFSPGFAYLGGLPEELATPRLPLPRTRVPAGSVGIAGRQTGVYPAESPGGWRIIGRSSLSLFRPERTPPALLSTGDLVRFLPVEEAS